MPPPDNNLSPNFRRRIATQRSAGGVIYKKEGNRWKICLIAKRGKKVWALPKGRVAAGETLEETAYREILEETGHEVEVQDLIDEIDYYFYYKENKTFYHKRVSFFMLKLLRENVKERDQEADDVKWFDLGQAKKRLTYLNERKVLRKAESILKLSH